MLHWYNFEAVREVCGSRSPQIMPFGFVEMLRWKKGNGSAHWYQSRLPEIYLIGIVRSSLAAQYICLILLVDHATQHIAWLTMRGATEPH